MKKASLIILLALFVSYANPSNTQTMKQSMHTTQQQADVNNFDYKNQNDWELEAGHTQSPINIITSNAVPKEAINGDIELFYANNILSIENTGHSIQVNTNGNAVINSRPFELKQFHFHHASEHTIDGKSYPIEAHFVHQSQNGKFAVIGVLFEEGEANKDFQKILDNANNNTIHTELSVHSIVPNDKSYYHYLGSLTTPPLTESVEWYVLKTPVTLSKEQIEEFTTLCPPNNRNIQPLNDRIVLEYTE